MEEKSKLYIPKKCKVGFQKREDTYSKLLGYIIYHDGKVWRKETSWEGWRHKEGQKWSEWNSEIGEREESILTGVEPIEFDNIPTEGFVLNKKAGGYSTGWNHRQTYCRCYDPRGWEFEITIPNLLYILQECNAYKGKGLEGEFVYSWDGKDLVLLPTSSLDYKECEVFTELQSKKIGKKDLVEGCTYLTSRVEKLVYLGQHNITEDTWYNRTELEDNNSRCNFTKKYVFRNVDGGHTSFTFLTGLTKIKEKVSDDVDPNFANYIDDLQKSEYYSLADHLIVEPISDKKLKDIFRGWGTTIYKFGDIHTKNELNFLKRRLDDSRTENGKWDVSTERQVKRESGYWGGGSYYDTKYDIEGTFTKEEVVEYYGILVRVYKNGFKKPV
jgi:hypothetical protein